MAVRTKNRRKIKVRDRNFVWYIAEERDLGDFILHVASEDNLIDWCFAAREQNAIAR